MSAKIHWNLLILFGVLCQGIITLSEKNIDESSELRIRQKRVINNAPGGDQKELIRNFPYVVSIKGFRSNFTCVGVILAHNIVLTAAKCVQFEIARLKVYSGSAQAVYPSATKATIHKVTDKRILLANHPFRPADGIALVTVKTPFFYSINTGKIDFYDGPVEPGLHGIVSGWGCNPVGYERGTAYPHNLRSITVPIISNDECKSLYKNILPITENDICTLDPNGHQYCGVDDAGAPLVVNVNNHKYLVGIHLWNGAVVGRSNPDVFIDLQYPRYKHWILETIPNMEEASVSRI